MRSHGKISIAGVKRTIRRVGITGVCVAAWASFTTPGFADVLLDVGDGAGNPGNTIAVSVTIVSTGGSRATAIVFDVLFDQARLAIDPNMVACGASCLAAGAGAYAAVPSPGDLRVIVFGGGAIPDGELVRLPFVVAQGASGCSGLNCQNLSVSDPNANSIPGTCLPGGFQTGPCVPTEVGGLTVLSDRRTLLWSPAPSCPGTIYDAVRGQLDRLPVGSLPSSETCIGNDLSATLADDPVVPQKGKGLWYLVRERSTGCIAGTYGYTSYGLQRNSTACP